jgi:ABC-type Fe3+ transport system permease subunit
MPKQQQAARGACWHRALALALVLALAVAVISVGAAGITQATKCKNTLLACSATSDQAGCRQAYGQCAINAFPLVVTCIFLLMGTTVVGMLVHVWWTKQARLQEQQQEQVRVTQASPAICLGSCRQLPLVHLGIRSMNPQPWCVLVPTGSTASPG